MKPSDVVSEPWRLWNSVNARDKVKTAASVGAGVAVSGTVGGPAGAVLAAGTAGAAWMATDAALLGVGTVSAFVTGESRLLRGRGREVSPAGSIKKTATRSAALLAGGVGTAGGLVGGLGVVGSFGAGLTASAGVGSATYLATDVADAATHAVQRHRELSDEEPRGVSVARSVGRGVADRVGEAVSAARDLFGGDEDASEERRGPDGGVTTDGDSRALVTDELEPRVSDRDTDDRSHERSAHEE